MSVSGGAAQEKRVLGDTAALFYASTALVAVNFSLKLVQRFEHVVERRWCSKDHDGHRLVVAAQFGNSFDVRHKPKCPRLCKVISRRPAEAFKKKWDEFLGVLSKQHEYVSQNIKTFQS